MFFGTCPTFFYVTKFCFGSTSIMLCLHRSKQYCSKAECSKKGDFFKSSCMPNSCGADLLKSVLGPAPLASFQTQVWNFRKYPFFICHKILFRRHYFIIMLSSKFLIMCLGTYPTFFSVTKYYFGITSILTMGALWLASFQKGLSKANELTFLCIIDEGEMFKYQAVI